MTVEALYRSRIRVTILFGIVSAGLVAVAVMLHDPWYLGLAILMAVAAFLGLSLARDSYRFDRGLTVPPEWRELVKESDEWAKNGYRTPEEVAAGVPPRSRPPNGTRGGGLR